MVYSEIVPNLYVGDLPDSLQFAADYNDGMIICVLESRPISEPRNATWIPILSTQLGDGLVWADPVQLDTVKSVIDNALLNGRKVLVHCGAGIERSPLAVAWYLAKTQHTTIEDAYEIVRKGRSQTQVRTVWLKEKPNESLPSV